MKTILIIKEIHEKIIFTILTVLFVTSKSYATIEWAKKYNNKFTILGNSTLEFLFLDSVSINILFSEDNKQPKYAGLLNATDKENVYRTIDNVSFYNIFDANNFTF